MAEIRVLVPLDGSAFSRSILTAVRSLFVPERARITLFRVGDAPPHVGAPPARRTVTSEMILPEPEEAAHVWDSQEWESARQRLRDELGPPSRRLERDGWTVDLATAFGDPAEEIVAWCVEHRPDLVAMATHGRTGLSRALLGSVAERALRRLAVPVLMVRPEDVRGTDADAAEDAGHAGPSSAG
ncbi:MAG: universal stress protein [Trueperaceae bacterium]|nr:universal stress protein [Trueperaceae bacterium]